VITSSNQQKLCTSRASQRHVASEAAGADGNQAEKRRDEALSRNGADSSERPHDYLKVVAAIMPKQQQTME